jgi:hypothetical protein
MTGSPQELELATQVQGVLWKDLTGVQAVLGSDPAATTRRYDALLDQHPLWSRAQVAKAATKSNVNKATRLGGAAGGLALLPGWGTSLSLAAVAASSVKMLAHCVDSIDTVARSHGFDLDFGPWRRLTPLLEARRFAAARSSDPACSAGLRRQPRASEGKHA